MRFFLYSYFDIFPPFPFSTISVFSGALLPYLISWTLYQGKLLITVLNWAGLVINGSVAFILPLVLILKVMDRRKIDNLRRFKIKQLVLLGIISENNNENNLLIDYFVAKNVNNNVDNMNNRGSNSSNSSNSNIVDNSNNSKKECVGNGNNVIRRLISDDTDNGYGHDEVIIFIFLIFLILIPFFHFIQAKTNYTILHEDFILSRMSVCARMKSCTVL